MLDFIACRLKDSGQLKGDIWLDGTEITEELFQKKAGYVIQADRLMANLSVRETLTYTALLQAANKEESQNDHVTQRVFFFSFFNQVCF